MSLEINIFELFNMDNNYNSIYLFFFFPGFPCCGVEGDFDCSSCEMLGLSQVSDDRRYIGQAGSVKILDSTKPAPRIYTVCENC